MTVMKSDLWDGYPAARERVFDMIDAGGVTNLAILTGDIHSSWALDVPRNPWTGYDPKTASGSQSRRDRHTSHQLAPDVYERLAA